MNFELGDLPPGVAEKMKATGVSHCCQAALIPGPVGGLSQNFWCEKCRVRFNLVSVPTVDWGQVVVLPPDLNFPGTKMPEPYIEFDTYLHPGQVETEDGGQAKAIQPIEGDDLEPDEGFFMVLRSWSETKDHHRFDRLIGERVRITITILPKKSGA